MRLFLSASGGRLNNSEEPYRWFGDGLQIEANTESTEEEQALLSSVIVTTGRETNTQYNLSLIAPDGSRVNINILTVEQELVLTVKAVQDKVIDQSMIYIEGETVTLVATGGLGEESYEFSLENADEPFNNPNDLGPPLNGQAIYTLPAASVSSRTDIAFSVESRNDLGQLDGQPASTSLTLFPPLSLVTKTELVAGSSISIDANGGTEAYTFATDSNAISISPTAGAPDTRTITVSEGITLSDDLNNPATVSVTVSDNFFTNEIQQVPITLYPAPRVEYKVIGNSDVFVPLEDAFVDGFTDISGNALIMSVLGGTGSTNVKLIDISPANFPVIEGGIINITSADNKILSSAEGGGNINAVDDTMEINNLDGGYLSIFPSDTNGSVTFEVSSGSSSNTYVVNFFSSLEIDFEKLTDELGVSWSRVRPSTLELVTVETPSPSRPRFASGSPMPVVMRFGPTTALEEGFISAPITKPIPIQALYLQQLS